MSDDYTNLIGQYVLGSSAAADPDLDVVLVPNSNHGLDGAGNVIITYTLFDTTNFLADGNINTNSPFYKSYYKENLEKGYVYATNSGVIVPGGNLMPASANLTSFWGGLINGEGNIFTTTGDIILTDGNLTSADLQTVTSIKNARIDGNGILTLADGTTISLVGFTVSDIPGQSTIRKLTLPNGSYLILNGVQPAYKIASGNYSDVDHPGDFRIALNNAINGIIDGNSPISTSFSDVLKISFNAVPPPQTVGAEVGEISITQMVHTDSNPDIGDAPEGYNKRTTTAHTISNMSSDALAADYYGDIFVEAEALSKDGYYTGTRFFKVIHEELSHALGIDILPAAKAGSIDISKVTQKYSVTAYATYGYQAQSNPENPNRQFTGVEDDDARTVTLYRNNPTVNEKPFQLEAYGLQLYDIAALQALYGRDYTTRQQATIYALDGVGLGRDDSDGIRSSQDDRLNAFIYTVWDGGGKDRIDVSDFGDISAKIDLRQGEFSSIGSNGVIGVDKEVTYRDANGDPQTRKENQLGLFRWVVEDDGRINYFRDAGNVAIAYHTVIEDAVGSSSHDVIIGNAWQNTLWGGAGNDYIFGDGNSYRENLNDADASQDSGQGYVYTDTLDPNDPNRAVPAPPILPESGHLV